MRPLPPFDRYDAMLAVIRARMRLHFALSPKGDAQARKIFVIGYPRSGTTSLHALFEANGIRSRHTAGDWKTARFDAFSDFGQMRPFAAYDRYYANARFVLNLRPTDRYLMSLVSQVHPNWRFNDMNFAREILRRARFFENVFRHFNGRDDLCVVNIERPGAIGFIADFLDLAPPDSATERPRNVGRRDLREHLRADMEAGFARLGVTDKAAQPVITLRELGLSGRFESVADLNCPKYL